MQLFQKALKLPAGSGSFHRNPQGPQERLSLARLSGHPRRGNGGGCKPRPSPGGDGGGTCPPGQPLNAYTSMGAGAKRPPQPRTAPPRAPFLGTKVVIRGPGGKQTRNQGETGAVKELRELKPGRRGEASCGERIAPSEPLRRQQSPERGSSPRGCSGPPRCALRPAPAGSSAECRKGLRSKTEICGHD